MEAKLLSNNISKEILQGELRFLISNIQHCGYFDFRLMPFQKLDKKDFNNIYKRSLSRNPAKHIDFIGAYHVMDDGKLIQNNRTNRNFSDLKTKSYRNLCHDHSDEAHIIYKLDNGYWVYTHLYSDYSGLTWWGVDDMITYVSKDIDELITFGIDWKYLKLLGLVSY